MRRESSVAFGGFAEGINVTFTRKGIEVSGHYDLMVSIEGGSLTWEQIDAIRADLAKVRHREDDENGCAICTGGTGSACSWHFL